jgi:predicted flap endonuclease-1-like 5' DNA nuclease
VTTLIGEIILWLVLAAALGLGTGWLLWGVWAQRPPSTLPTDEELRRMRADLERAEERAAELRAEVSTLRARLAASPASPPPSGRSVAAVDLRSVDRRIDVDSADRSPGLRSISGIGPKLERTLAALGVHSVEQLADLTDAEVDALDAALGEFRGRMRREDWVGQARQLQRGR